MAVWNLGGKMSIIKKCKKYRKIGMKLNYKIMDKCLNRGALKKSAKLLGIVQGGTFVFDSDDETSVLMDFALNDHKVNHKNAIEMYREKYGWKNEIEKEILDARIDSYTSLFKVISISKTEHTLLLRDLLNKKDNMQLTDIGLSRTAIPELLVFFRLVSFKDFNITSGVAFAFPPNMEDLIVRKYKMKRKKIKSNSESIKRYVSFFKLSKMYGIDVAYR